MNSFNLTLVDNHPIMHVNNNVILIDTGAPSTIHHSEELAFYLSNFNVRTNYIGITTDTISELLGYRITTLLGGDILSKFKLIFDYKNKTVGFDTSEIDFSGNEMFITKFMGIPIVEAVIDNQSLKFFLDSGAKLSYLPDNITRNYTDSGVQKDFYPGVGEFETKCYQINAKLKNEDFDVNFGNLPPLLQMTINLGGVNGILGFDFFNSFKVMLDLEKNRLVSSKNTMATRENNIS